MKTGYTLGVGNVNQKKQIRAGNVEQFSSALFIVHRYHKFARWFKLSQLLSPSTADVKLSRESFWSWEKKFEGASRRAKVVQSRSTVKRIAVLNAKQFPPRSTYSKSRRLSKFSASRKMLAVRSRVGLFLLFYFSLFIRSLAKRIAVRCVSYCRVDEQKVLFDTVTNPYRRCSRLVRIKSHCPQR